MDFADTLNLFGSLAVLSYVGAAAFRLPETWKRRVEALAILFFVVALGAAIWGAVMHALG